MTNLRCRLITAEDSADVLNWRNDFTSRQMSLNAGIVLSTEHSNWFSKMLDDNSHLGFIGEITGEKIGVVFMKIQNGKAKVSMNLNPVHRGKKYGVILLRGSIQVAKNLLPKIGTFTAEIKNTNIASINVFAKNGFILDKQQDEILTYSVKFETLGVKSNV